VQALNHIQGLGEVFVFLPKTLHICFAQHHRMQLVTVYSTHNYIEANIVKGRLQHEGILCFIKDEYSVTIDPLIGYSINWMKLQVRPEDEGIARTIIDTVHLNENPDADHDE
jgi:hypothetical protein